MRVGVLQLVVGKPAISTLKPPAPCGGIFVIQFPSLVNAEGATLPAAASASDLEHADAERDLESLSKFWLVNSGELTR